MIRDISPSESSIIIYLKYMALTQEQILQIKSQVGLQSAEPQAPRSRKEIAAEFDQQNVKEKGIGRELVEGVATPFAKFAVSGISFVRSVLSLGKLGIDKISGGELTDEEAQNFINTAKKIEKGFNVPGLGQIKPPKTAKEAVGIGLEIGSFVAGGGTIAQATKLFGKKAVLQAIKTGAIQGTVEGVAGGAGIELQEEDATLGSVATGAITGGVVGAGAGSLAPGLSKVVGKGARKTADVATNIGQKVQPVIEGVGDIATRTQRSVSNIPTKVSTNLAEKRIATKAINELPTEIARKTASLGVDVQDVNTILRIQNKAKPEIKELFDSVKDFASGTSKVRPEEVVGKPILKVIKQLESNRSSVGKELGEVAKDLGVVSRGELVGPVFNKLKSVIKGLELEDGKLIFKNTVLTTKETLADRKAIQSIFEQATKWGSGSKKHKLRQELFEILGGKKKSLSNMTGTQERSFNAVRQALSDVLDTKNPAYKKLNAEFVKFNNPLLDLNKMMRGVEGADEEVVSMMAGLLTRRLTSNTTSGVKFRKVLSDIDKALKGETLSSLEDLQDVYNVLDKYYDIAGKTSFKGLIKSSIPEGGDLSSRAFDAATGLTKETPAVRQKAVEDLLLSILQ